MDKKIKALRTFFRALTAVFECQESIQLAVSGYFVPNKLHQLHKLALIEIEKENPNLSLIDDLLSEMGNIAKQMNYKNK